MLLDTQNLFSDDQALTGSANSTNVIDLGVALREPGKGVPVEILIQLVVAAGGTSPTIFAALQVDDNDSFSSAKEVARSSILSGGAIGDRLSIFYLPEGMDERYARLAYTLAGTSPTYTVTAGIVLGKDQPHGF